MGFQWLLRKRIVYSHFAEVPYAGSGMSWMPG